MRGKPIARFVAVAAVLALGAVALAQGGDWQEVTTPHPAAPPASSRPRSSQAPTRGEIFIACGERVREASEPYKSMVQQLNDMHGENFHVYETIAPTGPHAVSGGCIMYNRIELQSLVQRWMGISDPDTVRPMLYAAFAHEFGHLEHGDVEEQAVSRTQARERELNADRFAGYTLSRLGLARLDPDQLTFYYRLLGDDFAGAGAAGYHGSSEERSAALQDGWHRGELGLPEAGGEPAAGLGHP